ncbi:hypothetical protein RUM8411_00055 [Ruegeria meonggei]|uniref:Uncharacterized protein n=1 Tax=Ruegeria meonggei TaxID=1446476 RepID=A0A1X6Y495_9RHOB|nr:hypothetical protein RUM8411_00055 [Ruegeria meonggei]
MYFLWVGSASLIAELLRVFSFPSVFRTESVYPSPALVKRGKSRGSVLAHWSPTFNFLTTPAC